MIGSEFRLFLILPLLGFLGAGCMSARSPEPFGSLSEPDLSRETLSKSEPLSMESPREPNAIGPAWKQVHFRGRVLSRGSQQPLGGAVVSVFEGEDRLFTTITDEEGMFELPANLYGLEVENESGEAPGWKPEAYYSLRVDAGSDGAAERRLSDIRLDERLVLHVG